MSENKKLPGTFNYEETFIPEGKANISIEKTYKERVSSKEGKYHKVKMSQKKNCC